MTWTLYIAAFALAGLAAYVVLAGADFGGGVWDLLARGPRAEKQRAQIAAAIAPVWEANHVWLILLIVILFTCFPAAFALIMTALHIPLSLMLLGIVFRGSAFVFAHYDPTGGKIWGRIFAISSAVTPLFLGMTLGAITSGSLGSFEPLQMRSYVDAWFAPFPFAVGLLAVVLGAHLAAVYLAAETEDGELQTDFRNRAWISQIVLAGTAWLCIATGIDGAPAFADRLLRSPWAIPLQIVVGILGLAVAALLYRRRFLLARAAAALQAVLIVAGWGAAQFPYLIYPVFTLESAAAPEVTLRLMGISLTAGLLVLVPSLIWLLRVFKTRNSAYPRPPV